MTLESCAAFCSGYTYFGVEYARECYCGNSFGAGSVVAPATDCNFPCAGNSTEYCGAGNRLSVYAIGAAASSSTLPSGTATQTVTSTAAPVGTGFPTGWTNQGCWVDGVSGRILSYQAPDSQTLTQQSCALLCSNAGYTVSGTEYASQCFCGNGIQNGGVVTASTDCNTACSGDSTETCGGGSRMTIVSKGVPNVASGPAPQQQVGDWTYQGCEYRHSPSRSNE